MATITEPAPSAGRRRSGASLATRIFRMTALLIVLAVGAAVAVTFFLGNRIADRAVREELATSRSLQDVSQQQQYRQLQLAAQVFLKDSAFRPLIAEASQQGDAASILNVLEERRELLRFDFAIVLDPGGKVLARTDQPNAVGQDLSPRALVAVALKQQSEAAGIWQEGNRLYEAVAVPISQDFILQGLFVTGSAISDERAREVRKTSATEVVYLAETPSGTTVVASSLEAGVASQLLAALRTGGGVLARVMQGEAADRVEVTLDGAQWIALLSPLRDATGKTVGAAVTLASLAKATASYHQIESLLVAVGLASMLLAGALSFLLSRRALRPIRQLAAAAEAARQGNYDQRIGLEGNDEVGKMAHAFDTLLSDLRERRDMEAYVADLSRNLPTSVGGEALSPPQARRLSLVAVELRAYAKAKLGADAADALERLGRDLRRIATLVATQKGRVEAVAGHRVLASFEGEAASYRALAAAAEIMSALGQAGEGFAPSDPPTAAVVAGEVVTGSVVWGEAPSHAVVGLTVQQLEALLREAAPGDILLSKEAHAELAAAFQQAGVELYSQRGILGGQALFTLNAEMAARITGVEIGRAPAATLPSDPGTTLSGIAPGTLLGQRFQILSVLGAGGMGVVYKARDRELDDLVALKMLKREMGDDPGVLERLKSELKLARKITHPNVLRTFDFGEVNGLAYISMEYVRGITLRYLLDKEGRLPYSAGLRLAKQICAGLGAAHAQGVIHRDIKPENLILDQMGNAKLMDFGIARPTQRLTPGQTRAGWILGTPQYLSPEQLEGKEPDTRADIYACGVVFYEMFTGQLPFTGDTPVAVIMKHLNEDPAPPSTHWAEIPKPLEALILKCLEKDRDKRYSEVGQMQKELEALSA